MSEKKAVTDHHFGSISSYITGFLLCIVITLISYIVVESHGFNTIVLITIILTLAFIQLIVQLLFFLHLGQEKKPRWNLYFFVATVGMMLLVVVGSIWIMNHLNYNMMPKQMEKTLIQDEGIKK